MRIDGGCHCGRITYEAEADPDKVSICHCTDCQNLTGTAFRVSVPVRDVDLAMTGEPKVYVKRGESGNPRAQGFCPDCGSHLFATGVGEGPKVYNIRTGTSRQRQQLVPKRQIWCRSALGWLPEFEGMASVEKGG